MSDLAIRDLETTVLDRVEMRSITGGGEVRIEKVSSTIQSTDSPTLDAGTFGALFDIVAGLLEQDRQRRDLHQSGRPA